MKVCGVNVKKYSSDELRGAIGMVLQKNVLFSGTIRENLKWGDSNATDEEIESALITTNARSAAHAAAAKPEPVPAGESIRT